MSHKKPAARREGTQQMSHHKYPTASEAFLALTDNAAVTANPSDASDGSASQQGNGGGLVVIADDTRLSVDQRETARELLRLYESLCGAQPGQYWPQALLETAGSLSRPLFPRPVPTKGGR